MRRDPKKERSMVLKMSKDKSSEEEQNIAYVIQIFQILLRSGGFQNRGNLNRGFKSNDCCTRSLHQEMPSPKEGLQGIVIT